MDRRIESALQRLASSGWKVEFNRPPRPLPPAFSSRYDWIPNEVLDLFCTVRICVAPSEKAWLITSSEIDGSSGAAFAWNQWERDSLDAAEDDEGWKKTIAEFWDRHCPLVVSVDRRYSYLALRRGDRCVVGGEEPEYEEPVKVANSMVEMLEALCDARSEAAAFL